MSSLFSVFNPKSLVLYLNWGAPVMIFSLPSLFWMSFSVIVFFYLSCISFMSKEMKSKTFTSSSEKLLLSSLFFLILTMNMMGLLPYVFTNTSHLSMTVSLALPFWLGYNFFNFVENSSKVMSHFVPKGTPAPLVPLMVIIEMVSLFIRPLTLSVRLGANMTAGHLILTLVSMPCTHVSYLYLSMMLLAIFLLSILEMAVSFIQAYVFVLLTYLYIQEVDP